MALFRKKKDLKPIEEGDPIMLIMGSLAGCAKKDALAYARGLAERYLIATEVVFIHVGEDRANNRFIYEVREGGPPMAMFETMLAALQTRGRVRLALANGRSVIVEESHGEIYSLISAPDEEGDPEAAEEPRLFHAGADELELEHVGQYQGGEKMSKLYNEGEKLPLLAGLILSIAFFAFVMTGATYTLVQGGAFEADAELTPLKDGHFSVGDDNPAWQLGLAKKEADEKDAPIHFLKKDDKGWSWEIKQ